MTPLHERQAVRAILLTAQEEILLMRIRNPETRLDFWICPGGGVQEGEEPAAALRRELREELSLHAFNEGHLVHRRHHIFRWKGRRISQREMFFLVPVEKFTPVNSDPVEAEVLEEFRWFPLAELARATAPVTPPALERIVRSYLREGPPRAELVVEFLEDA